MAGQNTVLLDVKGMTCQGCVNSVTRIVKRKDPDAQVSVDLASGRVTAQTGSPADDLAHESFGGGERVTDRIAAVRVCGGGRNFKRREQLDVEREG